MPHQETCCVLTVDPFFSSGGSFWRRYCSNSLPFPLGLPECPSLLFSTKTLAEDHRASQSRRKKKTTRLAEGIRPTRLPLPTGHRHVYPGEPRNRLINSNRESSLASLGPPPSVSQCVLPPRVLFKVSDDTKPPNQPPPLPDSNLSTRTSSWGSSYHLSLLRAKLHRPWAIYPKPATTRTTTPTTTTRAVTPIKLIFGTPAVPDKYPVIRFSLLREVQGWCPGPPAIPIGAMLLPKGGINWKSAQARLPPTRAIWAVVTKTRFILLLALTGLILLLWRGIRTSASEMQRYVNPRLGSQRSSGGTRKMSLRRCAADDKHDEAC